MKNSFPLYVVLLIIIALLLVVNGITHFNNKLYENENRTLILENDSIISININLRDSLSKIENVQLKKITDEDLVNQ